MPRKRPQLEDPDDPNEVMKFIKALAKHSNYKNLQKLVSDDPAVCHTPTLQRRTADEELDVNSQSRKAAVAIHVYGQVSQQACQKCKNHEGPFAECVVLADYNDLSLAVVPTVSGRAIQERRARGTFVMQRDVRIQDTWHDYRH